MSLFITYSFKDSWYRIKILDAKEGFHRCIDSWLDFPEDPVVTVQAGIESNDKIAYVTLQIFYDLYIGKYHHDYRKMRSAVSALINYTLYKSHTSFEESNFADIFGKFDKSTDEASYWTTPWWEIAITEEDE